MTIARTSRATITGALELDPEFADRLSAGKRETRLVGTSAPNYFRKPYGPGWALVGDAGYIKDPVTAQGIHDAFRDAELLCAAVGRCAPGLALLRRGTLRVPDDPG